MEKSSLIRLKGLVGPLSEKLSKALDEGVPSRLVLVSLFLSMAQEKFTFFFLPLQVKVSASSEIHFVSPHVRQKIRYGKEEKNETNKVFEILWKFMCSFFLCCLQLIFVVYDFDNSHTFTLLPLEPRQSTYFFLP